MKIAVLMAAIAVLALSCPLSPTGAIGAMETPLPPKAPWALAIPLVSGGDMGIWQVRTRPANMTLNVTSFSHRVLLRVNTTWLNATLLNVTVNGQVLSLDTGWHNLTFARYLDMIREYHDENVTLWRHVIVSYSTTQESHEEMPQAPVEPTWVKYRWAFVAAIAAVVIGLKAGKDMKEARLKAKWKKLLASKAMDLDKALQGMESEGHEGEDMGRFLLAA